MTDHGEEQLLEWPTTAYERGKYWLTTAYERGKQSSLLRTNIVKLAGHVHEHVYHGGPLHWNINIAECGSGTCLTLPSIA